MFTTFRTISFAILSLFLFNVAGAPSATTPDDSTPTSIGGVTIGEIINALGVGLVSNINTDITVSPERTFASHTNLFTSSILSPTISSGMRDFTL